MPKGVSVADHAPDYATRGRIGIATPQANPTVEPEMALLMPPGAALHMVRLTSDASDSLQRLVDYIERLPDYAARFDTMKLRGFGFACTGSTYLVGRDRALAIQDKTAEMLGCPVESAAEALLQTCETLGIASIAIAAPYPGKLGEASLGFWRDNGLTITAHTTIDIGTGDTRAIYGITADTALGALERFDLNGADALLLTGTGMPSLKVIDQARDRLGVPIVSSNYCLAWRLSHHVMGWTPTTADPLLSGWQDRLAQIPALADHV